MAALGVAPLLYSPAAAQRARPAPAPAVAYDVRTPPEPGARSLDRGWRFHHGDIPASKVSGHRDSYNNAKAGRARDAAAADYDDGDWREVDLPHDWAIEAPPVASENMSQGYRARGFAWYRRAIRLEPSERGRYLEIQLGAIATNATIWFNGNLVAHNWSGYNSVYLDVTAMALFGDELNSLVVRVDAEKMEGWWYEGAGLYRHAWLVSRAPVHIETDGVHADPRLRDGRWRLPVSATLYNIEAAPVQVELAVDLFDANDRVVASARAPATIAPLAHVTASLALENLAPRLWSVEDPYRYRVRTRVLRGGAVVDERVTHCGFRTIRFDADQGFFLNDQHVKLKGVCIHQDHAGVGVAVPDAIVEWRVRRLQAMGCNAIRSSHNAPDVALLDACDRLGMLVMDENRNFSVGPEYVAQLEWLVKRDRNRPCVIMWSVFNEEPIQGTASGYEMVRRMSAVVKALDDSRPVTAAMNGGMFTPVNVSQAVDVVGFNYQPQDYDRFHAANPTLPMTSSEDTSAFITRGEWTADKARQIMPSDDSEAARWGATHRAGWKAIDTRPYLAGGFVWTGFDYHGESTPFGWPSKSSYFGIMDLCGFAKSAFYIHRAHWVKDRPVLHILPHWNWAGKEGQPIAVMIASNAERVELRLNGRRVAEGPVDPYDMASFAVPYAPGRLEARAFRGGREIATTSVETAGAVARLRLVPDRDRLLGDGRDAQPVTIEAIDARGRFVPTANAAVTLTIANGRIIGLGNGDPTGDHVSKGERVSLFNGLAQVIVQTARGAGGKLLLSAAADGLTPARLVIGVTPAEMPEVAPAVAQLRITGWRQSPATTIRPDPRQGLADNDMNSWTPVTAGTPPAPAASAGYSLLSASVRLPARYAKRGGVVRLEGVTGRAELWLDNARVAEKADAGTGPIEARYPPGARTLQITLLVQQAAGQAAGLAGLAFLR